MSKAKVTKSVPEFLAQPVDSEMELDPETMERLGLGKAFDGATMRTTVAALVELERMCDIIEAYEAPLCERSMREAGYAYSYRRSTTHAERLEKLLAWVRIKHADVVKRDSGCPGLA